MSPATELTRAFIAQVERVNPRVNAIVTFPPEQALAEAKRIDDSRHRGPIAGLPIAFKDVVPTKGIRTTFGSSIFEHHVPAEDHAMVERVRAAGAITIGKTNTPEFAIEAGLALGGPQVGCAMALRSEIYTRMRKFTDRYEFLLLPVNQVVPFPVEREYRGGRTSACCSSRTRSSRRPCRRRCARRI